MSEINRVSVWDFGGCWTAMPPSDNDVQHHTATEINIWLTKITPALPAEHWLSIWTTRTLESDGFTSNTIPTPNESETDLEWMT